MGGLLGVKVPHRGSAADDDALLVAPLADVMVGDAEDGFGGPLRRDDGGKGEVEVVERGVRGEEGGAAVVVQLEFPLVQAGVLGLARPGLRPATAGGP
ncbi:MAG: hypothetical protein JNM99_04215 [Verrucomicrobiaceae bacterium]|nr:hypothetical protein [Verrucomicrobiaceae bacterium]